MIKKQDAQPGTLIIFDRDPMISVIPAEGKRIITEIYADDDISAQSNPFEPRDIIVRYDTAIILHSPKKNKDGGNVIWLRFKEQNVYCFWNDVYYNASVVRTNKQ